MNQQIKKTLDWFKELFIDSGKTSFELFKIMIPICIITKILDDMGAIEAIGAALSPVMQLVGLPGSMGLVWGTAMITNVYGGLVVFASLAPQADLSVAQVTVLATMILVAHTLPVELRIAQKAGTRLRMMAFLRISSALLLGWILHCFYSWGNYLQDPNKALWEPSPQPVGWLPWAWAQTSNLFSIFLIITFLLLVMKILKSLGIINILCRWMEPMLTALGMSKDAAPLTMIGMTLGIAFGGGLIIREAQSGRLSKADVFYSLALMGLSHSLIEDTLLMVTIGGHLSGIFWARIIFTLVVMFLLVRFLSRMKEESFNRLFIRSVKS